MTLVAGYDYDHQKTRERLLPDAYNKPCPMCGNVMLKGQDLDLDHSTPKSVDSSSRGDRIVHASCNRSEGGVLGQKEQKFRPSRQWL